MSREMGSCRKQHVVNYKVLEEIASKTSLHIDFGGGLKSDKDLHIAFESGAKQITGGSIAVKKPDIFKGWLKEYEADKIILGADAQDEKVAISGWMEASKEELIPFINNYKKEGITYVICTDIAKDGMLQGPSFELYKRILSEIPGISLIASGGISHFDELAQLSDMGCEGTIIGKAIYEQRISMEQLEKFVLGTE